MNALEKMIQLHDEQRTYEDFGCWADEHARLDERPDGKYADLGLCDLHGILIAGPRP